MREQKVAVAVVQDDGGRFLVHFNPKWGGYTFPMKAVDAEADALGSTAVRAVEDDLGCQLPRAHAEELDFLGRVGQSGRTGETAGYEYWLFAVDPGRELDLAAAPAWNNNPPLFLSFQELTGRTDRLTESASAILREFVDNQDVALSVITRQAPAGPEVLLVWNANYGGYFFPVRRVKTELTPDKAAIAAVRSDLGYRGPAAATWRGEVSDVHFSDRFQVDRNYRFHVCQVEFSEIDLQQSLNPLEQSIERQHRRQLWVPMPRPPAALPGESPTLAAVWPSVMGLIASRPL